MSYEFGASLFNTVSELHDGIVRQWIGADRKPTLEDVVDVLADFDREAGELEIQWGMNTEQEGYDREELRQAVVRLREELGGVTLEDLQDAWKRGYASISSGPNDDLTDLSTFVGCCVDQNGAEELALETITQEVVDQIAAGTQSDIRQHNEDNAEEIEAGEVEAMDGETWAYDIGRAYAALERRAEAA